MLFSRHKSNWVKYGRLIEAKRVVINGNEYQIEVIQFNSYQKALSKTFKVVQDISEHGEILDKKSDLYDWTSTIMRFADTTIEVKNIRPEHKIVVAQSIQPLSIEEFERDNAIFNYNK